MPDSDLKLTQRITQRISQQQIRFVRLLEMSAPEMEEAVERELEANPALTTIDADSPASSDKDSDGDPSEGYRHPDSSHINISIGRYNTPRDPNADSDRPIFTPRDDSETLADVLKSQIDEHSLDTSTREAALYIIGNLDTNGWLTRPLPLMMNDMAINYDRDLPEDVWKKAFDLVRMLEPAGVGALSLSDCLLLQLKRLPESQEKIDAIDILENYFREYHMRHSHKIISGLKISRHRLDEANQLILSLNPKPGAQFGGNDSTVVAVIIPDFTINIHDGEIYIQLNNRNPDLIIEESFREAMHSISDRKRRQQKGSEFIVSNYNDARDFIDLVHQRQRTLLNVMGAIASYQKEYFLSDDVSALRPMSLKDIAAITGYDISVISRATNNKFVAMPGGEVLPLRSFFSGQVNAPAPGHHPTKAVDTDKSDASKSDTSDSPEEELTNLQIQSAIKTLVEKEDPRHPLSDAKLRDLLAENGYDISRRTVAKYRDRAGIAIARLRRKF